MTASEVWLARHGETDWSAQLRHTGRTDIPLNANGRAAAERLGRLLSGEAFETRNDVELAFASVEIDVAQILFVVVERAGEIDLVSKHHTRFRRGCDG